jgi:hypothetical protein
VDTGVESNTVVGVDIIEDGVATTFKTAVGNYLKDNAADYLSVTGAACSFPARHS